MPLFSAPSPTDFLVPPDTFSRRYYADSRHDSSRDFDPVNAFFARHLYTFSQFRYQRHFRIRKIGFRNFSYRRTYIFRENMRFFLPLRIYFIPSRNPSRRTFVIRTRARRNFFAFFIVNTNSGQINVRRRSACVVRTAQLRFFRGQHA